LITAAAVSGYDSTILLLLVAMVNQTP